MVNDDYDENNTVCRKCPLHCTEAIQGTSSQQPPRERRLSEATSSQSTINSKEVHFPSRPGEENSKYKYEKRNREKRPDSRMNCDCKETWQRDYDHRRQSIVSTSSSRKNRSSIVPVPCCSCAREGTQSSISSNRKEFDIKQHGWREWEKNADNEQREQDESKKKLLIDSIVKTFEEDKNKPMLHRVSQKTMEEMQQEKTPASKRYGVQGRRLSHTDPDNKSSTNN